MEKVKRLNHQRFALIIERKYGIIPEGFTVNPYNMYKFNERTYHCTLCNRDVGKQFAIFVNYVDRKVILELEKLDREFIELFETYYCDKGYDVKIIERKLSI